FIRLGDRESWSMLHLDTARERLLRAFRVFPAPSKAKAYVNPSCQPLPRTSRLRRAGLFSGGDQGSKRLAHSLAVLRGYEYKLHAVLITCPPANDAYQPHNRSGIAQPELQIQSLSRLQLRGNRGPDAAATQVHDAGRYQPASIHLRAYQQTYVQLESLRLPPIVVRSCRNPDCLPSFSLPTHDRLLSPLHQQLRYFQNTLMKCP